MRSELTAADFAPIGVALFVVGVILGLIILVDMYYLRKKAYGVCAYDGGSWREPCHARGTSERPLLPCDSCGDYVCEQHREYATSYDGEPKMLCDWCRYGDCDRPT